MGVRQQTVGVAPVGCSVLAYDFFNCDMQQASHGRAMAVARASSAAGRPGRLHLPGRRRPGVDRHGRNGPRGQPGEKITVIFVNNAIYGMTAADGADDAAGQIATTARRT